MGRAMKHLVALALLAAIASGCTFSAYEATYDVEPGESRDLVEASGPIEPQSTAALVTVIKVLPIREAIDAFVRLFTGQGETDRLAISHGAIARRTRRFFTFNTTPRTDQ